jgi:hypothetical protein
MADDDVLPVVVSNSSTGSHTSPFGLDIGNNSGEERIPLTRNNDTDTDHTPKMKPSGNIIEGTQLLDATETSSLLSTVVVPPDVDTLNYGSNQSLNMSDSVSNFSALLRGAKGVFDNYESKFKYALEAEYSAMEKFSIEIYREVRLLKILMQECVS